MLFLVFIAVLGAWLGLACPLFQIPVAILAFPFGLAWIGYRATSGKKAFLYGWLAGSLAAAGCLYWLVIPVSTYGGLPLAVALPIPLLVGMVVGLFYAFFSLGLNYAGRAFSGIALCVLAGALWASIESLLGVLFTGFPWLSLSAAFAPWPVAVQGASILGVYGLSGVYVALAVGLLLQSTYRSVFWFTLGLAGLLIGFGVVRMHTLPLQPGDFRVAVVQGNVDQGEKWVPEYQFRIARKYAIITLEGMAENKPALVIWPETAMPFYLQDDSKLSRVVTDLADKHDVNILTGTPAYRIEDLKSKSYVLLNQAMLVNEDGRMLQSYDKEHLVPFGEYVPLQDWLPLDKLVAGVGDYVPGSGNVPIKLNGVALGMLICYEAIFPELAQRQVQQGATVLVNISNDAWFGDTPAPSQHLNHAVMRAIEQSRWLVRSTNTGISAFIDPLGRIRLRSGLFREEYLAAEVSPMTRKTVFHTIFNWVSPGAYLLTVAGFLLAWFKRRSM